MADLRIMPSSGSGATTILDVLDQARQHAIDPANNVTDIIIVFQQRDGKKPWFARDDAEVASMMFLLQMALFNFSCMVAGIKV
jgi:hypothetical protein